MSDYPRFFINAVLIGAVLIGTTLATHSIGRLSKYEGWIDPFEPANALKAHRFEQDFQDSASRKTSEGVTTTHVADIATLDGEWVNGEITLDICASQRGICLTGQQLPAEMKATLRYSVAANTEAGPADACKPPVSIGVATADRATTPDVGPEPSLRDADFVKVVETSCEPRVSSAGDSLVSCDCETSLAFSGLQEEGLVAKIGYRFPYFTDAPEGGAKAPTVWASNPLDYGESSIRDGVVVGIPGRGVFEEVIAVEYSVSDEERWVIERRQLPQRDRESMADAWQQTFYLNRRLSRPIVWAFQGSVSPPPIDQTRPRIDVTIDPVAMARPAP